jgi:hypothetical protein
MLERFLDIEVGEHGGGNRGDRANLHPDGFRLRFLIHHIGEGFFRSVELGPS